jgi:hypothetical protein
MLPSRLQVRLLTLVPLQGVVNPCGWGRMLAVTGGSNAPNAQVASHAIALHPCTLLTSDPDDIFDSHEC